MQDVQPESELIQCQREVRVRLNVYDLTSVNIPEHSFTTEFFIEVSWEEMDKGSFRFDEQGKCFEVDEWERQVGHVCCFLSPHHRATPLSLGQFSLYHRLIS